MAIQFNSYDGVFEIKGSLNLQFFALLKNHFETLLQHSKRIAISLIKVLNIDCSSVNIIASLQEKASLTNSIFFMIRMKNKKVNHQFITSDLNNNFL